MNPREHELSYPVAEPPPPAGAIQLADGVWWIRMPLPFALDHINLWLLRDAIDGREGWTVVDCGVARDDVKALWERVFAEVLGGLPILRVVVTHMHPDHVGLAHWLCDRWQVPLVMTLSDYALARVFSQGRSGAGGDLAAAHFHRHGVTDAESLEKIRQRAGYYPGLVPSLPDSYVRMLDGDVLRIGGRGWQVIVGYGHAPEHASLWCESLGVLISGDMVLPRISTNISVFDQEPEGNPLPLYLRSLDRYAPLPADTLVLPSHGLPFRGLQARIAQQREHHAQRLAEVLAACDQPRSAAEVVPVLFKRQLDLHQLTFALGEALAHLHALWFEGRLRRRADSDGVYRFVRCP